MEYKIVTSGSKGNAVIVNKEILVDCGIPYSKIKEYLYDVKYIFYTHIHGDHFKLNTCKAIIKNFPHIKIYGNVDIAYVIGLKNLTEVLRPEKEYSFDGFKMTTFECVHDVECFGFYFEIDGLDIIYATDTSSLDYAPDIKYDYLFIESNHCEKKLEEVLKHKSNYGYDVFGNAKRHLSTQQSKAFYYLHRKDKNSKWIELHKSERFY